MNGTDYPGATEKYPETQERQRQQDGRAAEKMRIHFEHWMVRLTPAQLTIPQGAQREHVLTGESGLPTRQLATEAAILSG